MLNKSDEHLRGLEETISKANGNIGYGTVKTEEELLREYEYQQWLKEKDEEERKQFLAYKEKEDLKLLVRSDTPFLFYFMEAVKELSDTLQKDPTNRNTYLGYMLILNTYLNRDGYLIKTDNAKKPLNRGGIKEVLEISSRQTSKKFIDKMIEQEILLEVETDKGKGFAVNNTYTHRGSLKGMSGKTQVIRVYSNTLREMYEENSVSDFTFIYSLLPYVDMEYNTLCFNPYENSKELESKGYTERLEVMSVQDIADVTGVSRATAFNKIRDLTFRGESVFGRWILGGNQSIIVNDAVMARGEFDEDSIVSGLFAMRGKAIE